jgi:hypothetical protein
MANVRVDMLTLRTSDNTVLAASHGRGLFSCTFNLDLTTSTPEIAESENPFKVFASYAGLEIYSTLNLATEYSVYTTSGSEVLSGKLHPGTQHQLIDTQGLSRGVYLVKVQAGNEKMVKKVVL